MNDMQSRLRGVAGFDAWIAVARACQLCQRALQKELDPLGLEVAHYDVLANVAYEEGVTQQVLARRLLVAKSNVSVLLSTLEQRGLVVRAKDKADARVRRLTLTAEGRGLVEAAQKRHAVVIEAMMAPITAQERRVVEDAMTRVSTALLARDMTKA